MSDSTLTTNIPDEVQSPPAPVSVLKKAANVLRAAWVEYGKATDGLSAAQLRLSRAETQLGLRIAAAFRSIDGTGTQFIPWVRETIDETAAPDVSVYRWRSGGLVGLRLMDSGQPEDLVSSVALTALTSLARFKEDKDLVRVFKKAVSLAKKDGETVPFKSHVSAAIVALFPDGDVPQGGGPAAGSGDARNGSTGAKDAPKGTKKAAAAPAREKDLAPVADKAATEAAVGTIGRILRTASKDLPETAYPVVRAAVYAAVQGCKDHGTENMLAAVSQLRDAKDAGAVSATK